MATVAESQSNERFEVGRVINLAFSTIGANALLLLGLGVVIAGIPQAVLRYFLFANATTLSSMNDPAAQTANNPLLNGNWIGFTAFMLISTVLGALLSLTLTRAAIEDLSDRQPTLGDTLDVALRLMLPTIAISFLIALGSGLGMILLIVPGVILWLGWSMSVPVLVQERLGVFGSMSRSRELTKGNRWSLLGIFLIVGVFMWIISAGVGLVALMIGGLAGGTLMQVVNALAGAITAVISATVAATSYIELRRVKEGAGIDELASIFA